MGINVVNQKMSQTDINGLKGNIPEGNNPSSLKYLKDNVPKGLDKATLESILAILNKQTEYFSAAEISKVMGISRVTVRRYLNYLCDSGWLKGILSYGSVGRPLHKYIKEDSFSI